MHVEKVQAPDDEHKAWFFSLLWGWDVIMHCYIIMYLCKEEGAYGQDCSLPEGTRALESLMGLLSFRASWSSSLKSWEMKILSGSRWTLLSSAAEICTYPDFFSYFSSSANPPPLCTQLRNEKVISYLRIFFLCIFPCPFPTLLARWLQSQVEEQVCGQRAVYFTTPRSESISIFWALLLYLHPETLRLQPLWPGLMSGTWVSKEVTRRRMCWPMKWWESQREGIRSVGDGTGGNEEIWDVGVPSRTALTNRIIIFNFS